MNMVSNGDFKLLLNEYCGMYTLTSEQESSLYIEFDSLEKAQAFEISLNFALAYDQGDLFQIMRAADEYDCYPNEINIAEDYMLEAWHGWRWTFRWYWRDGYSAHDLWLRIKWLLKT